jgi:hypothetical protein
MAGSVLTLPDHDNLVAMYLKSGKSAPAKSTSAANSGASSTPSSGGYATTDLNMNERKNWVRFP